jgi:transcriptional regulator with XRE-family HTH domain
MRTVAVNGAKMKERRAFYGYTQAALARLARGELSKISEDGKSTLSEETIAKWERGGNAFLTPLRAVAAVLKVDVCVLIAGIQSANSDTFEPQEYAGVNEAGKGATAVMEATEDLDIRISRDISNWPEEEKQKLLAQIAGFLDIKAIQVIRIRKGSVIMTLRLTPEQAKKLMWAVKKGLFKEWGAVDAEMVSVSVRRESDEGITSITTLLKRVREGDEGAAARLWERYFRSLLRLAARLLAFGRRGAGDEEDVVLSGFNEFFDAVRSGKYADLHGGDNLWRVLATFVAKQAQMLVRQEVVAKRGRGRVQGEAAFECAERGSSGARGFDRLESHEPDPALTVDVEERFQKFFAGLNDEQAKIVWLRMEGHGVKEIAGRVGLSPATVRRRLRAIRDEMTKLSWQR